MTFNTDRKDAFSSAEHTTHVRNRPVGKTGGYIFAVCLSLAICGAMAFMLTNPQFDDLYASLIEKTVAAAKSTQPDRMRLLYRLAGLPYPESVPETAIPAQHESRLYYPQIESDVPLGQDIEVPAHPEVAPPEQADKPSNLPDGRFPILARDFSQNSLSAPELLFFNATSYSVSPEQFKELPYPIRLPKSDPATPEVLIVCTHATESYVAGGTDSYGPQFTAERTTDPQKNVLLIAERLEETLTAAGVNVVRSDTQHDAENYTKAYTNSLATMNAYLAKYPGIKYIIDVHRDSIIGSDGTKYKPLITVDGEPTSQVMLVIGTDDGGAVHPNWRTNLTVACAFQESMNALCPTLARPINIRASRFNGHTAPGAMILEVGSCGSTFDEALRGVTLAGKAMAEVIMANRES